MKVHLPDRDEAPADVRAIFEAIENKMGFLPNFGLMLSHSPHVMRSYLHLSDGQAESAALSLREREVMLLAVSEFHGSPYCLAAHSAYARSAGFSDAELLAFRAGKGHEERLRFLAGFARRVAEQRGNLTRDQLDDFADWGYGAPALLDVVALVIESTFSNYVSLLTKVPVDFPEVEWVE